MSLWWYNLISKTWELKYFDSIFKLIFWKAKKYKVIVHRTYETREEPKPLHHKPKFLKIRNNLFIFKQCQQTIIQTHVNILCASQQVKIKVYMEILVIQKFLQKMLKKTFICITTCYIFLNNNLNKFADSLQSVCTITNVFFKLIIHKYKCICI